MALGKTLLLHPIAPVGGPNRPSELVFLAEATQYPLQKKVGGEGRRGPSKWMGSWLRRAFWWYGTSGLAAFPVVAKAEQ